MNMMKLLSVNQVHLVSILRFIDNIKNHDEQIEFNQENVIMN